MDNNMYGRLTGRKRWAIVIAGAVSGVTVALIFAWFAGRTVGAGDLIVGAAIGALLGLSASLGEKRRRRS
jgi:prepilin signal peptidase PulO-like enzyme (type II secretory pathway)